MIRKDEFFTLFYCLFIFFRLFNFFTDNFLNFYNDFSIKNWCQFWKPCQYCSYLLRSQQFNNTSRECSRFGLQHVDSINRFNSDVHGPSMTWLSNNIYRDLYFIISDLSWGVRWLFILLSGTWDWGVRWLFILLIV